MSSCTNDAQNNNGAARLPLLSSLVDGKYLESGDMENAVLLALAAYSNYRPAMRRIGETVLAEAAGVGAQQIWLTGGLPRVGDVLLLDAYGPNEHAITVQSVSSKPVSFPALAGTGGLNPSLNHVTFTGPLPALLSEGTLVAPVKSANDFSPRGGLQVRAGRDTYLMPGDFVRIDEDSFRTALGLAPVGAKGSGFYGDGVYQESLRLTSVGLGRASNYSTGFGGIPAPLPAALSGVGPALPTAVSGRQYRFLDTSAPVRLILSPAPTADAYLDFFYFGRHVASSVPSGDGDIVARYAAYVVLMMKAQRVNDMLNTKVADRAKTVDANAEELRAQAQQHLDQFEKRLRFVAYGTSG